MVLGNFGSHEVQCWSMGCNEWLMSDEWVIDELRDELRWVSDRWAAVIQQTIVKFWSVILKLINNT